MNSDNVINRIFATRVRGRETAGLAQELWDRSEYKKTYIPEGFLDNATWYRVSVVKVRIVGTITM
jgi:hypothetical protein